MSKQFVFSCLVASVAGKDRGSRRHASSHKQQRKEQRIVGIHMPDVLRILFPAVTRFSF